MKSSKFIPIIFSFALICLYSCDQSKKQTSTSENKFCLSDTSMKSIETAQVVNKPLYNELLLSGKISLNEDKVVRVFPLVGGQVEDLKVELGDYVEKGQILAYIRSGEIAEFEKELVEAQSDLIRSEKNLQAAEDMFKGGLLSEKELIQAKKEYKVAQSELKRIKETLSIYGVSKASVFAVKAPISGFIAEKNVTENMQLRTDNPTSLFTISDLDEVWVIANIYESDINKIKVGYDADIKVAPYPDKEFTGKIDKIFNMLDPATRVMKARIKMNNRGYYLKPEMSAQVNVKYSEGNKTALSIPSSCIIFDRNRNFVLVYKDKCDIETREIKILQQAGSTTYISEGLKENEKVITRSQLLVYNALNQ